TWEDFIQLHKHLKKCFNIEGPLKNYVFIIGDKEMNFGWSKIQIIDFLKQQKCSGDNPVRISNVEKEKEPSYHSRSKEDEEIVQKAFNRTFQDPSNLSERFIQFIDKCLDKYETTSNEYYAPYTTLIQASGTGKSKLLISVAEEIMTVYCCLREFGSSGYPPRSNIAGILIKEFDSEQEAKATYLAYICACFQKMQDFDVDCKKWLDGHTNKNLQENFWKDVENRMKSIKDDLMKCSTDSDTTESVKKYLVKKERKEREGSVKYLFAFDEARMLV
ncbi:1578_t:CDS:2, partial [Racocetra fulgida]